MATQWKDFSPTPFDPPGYLLDDLQDWYLLPVSRNRDSGILANSNFEVLEAELDEKEIPHEIHRFGHWGPGWFEVILVPPDQLDYVEELEARLSDYPLLDEEDYYEKRHELAQEIWLGMDYMEKKQLLIKYGYDFRLARRKRLPSEVDLESIYPID